MKVQKLNGRYKEIQPGSDLKDDAFLAVEIREKDLREHHEWVLSQLFPRLVPQLGKPREPEQLKLF